MPLKYKTKLLNFYHELHLKLMVSACGLPQNIVVSAESKSAQRLRVRLSILSILFSLSMTVRIEGNNKKATDAI